MRKQHFRDKKYLYRIRLFRKHSLMHHCNLIPLTPVPSGSLSHILAHSDSVWLSQAIIDSQGLCSALHVVARGHNLNSFLELTLFTLLSLFILFKLFYTALTFACIPIYVHCQGRLKGYWNGLMGFWTKCWLIGWWMDGLQVTRL